MTAAVVAWVVLDHFGWLGCGQRTAGPWQILQGLLMVGGGALISLF